jgi:hypothetical protein
MILGGYVAIGLHTRLLPDVAILVSATIIGAFLLPVFMTMDVVAAERAEGSLTCLLAMPVRPWAGFAVKIIVGGSACVLPFLAGLSVAILMAGDREVPSSRVFDLCLRGAGLGLILFVWTLSFGVRQPSEARTALVSIVIIFVWASVGLWEQRLTATSGQNSRSPSSVAYVGAVLTTLWLWISRLWLLSARKSYQGTADRIRTAILVMCAVLVGVSAGEWAAELPIDTAFDWAFFAVSPLGLLKGVVEGNEAPSLGRVGAQAVLALGLLLWGAARYSKLGRTRA